ncbi:MAG: peptidylprolyl isomerase [Gemmatimonadaceae bacterium]|nr:peptidylprolyl isomerase [Gemmatimonadaceae bacterium]
MIKHLRVLGLAGLTILSACDGLKEALTAHVDVVARAGSQELAVQTMADMMGKSQVPVRREVAQSIADAWVNFHLLGEAAINADSLDDRKLIDEVMWPVITQARTQKFYKVLTDSWVADTTNLEQKYATGELLAARHILFSLPQGQESTGSDSTLKKAEGVLARTTSANFAAMAKQYGSDGTKDQGGDLGVFAPSMMVPDFAKAVSALKPGEIGPLVKTQFGYHIVRRSTYPEVAEAFKQQWVQRQRTVSESTYITGLENAAKITIEPTVAKTVKALAADPAAHEDDNTAVAKSTLGTFRASDVVRWLNGFPNPDQVRSQIAGAPDSVMQLLVRQLLRNELILKAADSAKVTVDSTERAEIYKSFAAIVQNAFAGLRITQSNLQDSAKTKAEREKIVPARIDGYFSRLVNGQEQFVEIPQPVVQALRKKYEWKVNAAGLDRAVQAAQAIRAKEDSAKAAAMPKSAVPMPGGQPDSTRK